MGRTYTPEQRRQKSAQARRWYHANSDRLLAELRDRTPEQRQRVYETRRAREAVDPAVKARAAEAVEAYRLRNPQKIAEYAARYYASDKGKAASRGKTLRKFNLTAEQYDAMLQAQNGVCAICHQPETHKHRGRGEVVRLAIDHDHRCCPGTGSCGNCVRGLLCDRCNLGRWPDEPTLLRAAADYFERYGREH